jgi:hypothetical protein
VDFVGSGRSGEAVTGFDPDHEAHANATAEEIAHGGPVTGSGGVYPWLQAHPADVILLYAGTHGLSAGAGGVGSVLDAIDRWERSPEGHPLTVLVASIMDRSPSHPDVKAFNTSLAALVRARSTDPSHPAYPDRVVLVDQHAALNAADPRADGIHPLQTGYDAMADIWFDALTRDGTGILEKCP